MAETYGAYARRLRDERRVEAARLRRSGLSLRQIGARLGVSHVQVLYDLDHADRPTSTAPAKPTPSGPSSSALVDAMGGPAPDTGHGRAVPHSPGRKPPGWSGTLLDDPPTPGGHAGLLQALTEGPHRQ